MFSKKIFFNSAVVLAVSAAVLTGCVKQRKDKVDDGAVHFEGISQAAPMIDTQWKKSADADTFVKETQYTVSADAVYLKTQNSIAEKMIVERESGFKFLDVVYFKSTHPLLDGKSEVAYMLGEPGKTYPVVEELTPTHLIIYKVVADDELSFSEQSIALRYNGNWRVPVGGYKVDYFKKAKVKNEDNRETNVFTYYPIPSQDFKSATDYRVDKNNFITFKRSEKPDMLPKSFFEGEWYFTETTVDVRYDGASPVGDLGGSDSNFSSATRIKFKIFDDQIVGLNTNVDEDFKDDENSLNYNTVVRMKVEHRDFNWVRVGDQSLEEIEENVKNKESKRFVKIFYNESETPQTSLSDILSSLFGKVNNFKNVLDVTYGKNYFSYSIRDAQSGAIKRYSMRKINLQEQMVPRQAFKDDNRIFGAFTTTKYKKLDYKVAQQADIEKLIIMARHNPKKDIIYYFTDRTPKDDWYRDIGRSSIDLWNQAFVKAGLKIQIRLDESKDVALGDIRYNVLNIVKRAGAGLLGFGPSLIDSETGEIVSASMNTGVDNIVEQYYRVVRNYLGRKSGRFYDFKQDEVDTTLPNVLNLVAKVNSRQFHMDPISGQWLLNGQPELDASVFTDKEKEFLNFFKISPKENVKEFVKKVSDLRVHAYKHANLGGPFDISLFNQQEAGFTSTMVLDEVIENNCKEVVELAKTMETSFVSTIDEIIMIEPCVKLLAQPEAVLTTVHELGHNLSLRHNFRGSVDESNFPKLEDYTVRYVKLAKGAEKKMTSSIMEYVTQEGQQVMPGGYDLAAIRWIYNEEVELSTGKIIKIDTSKKIADNKIGPIKSYQFCTDEHRILVTDPMCNSFDQGTTVKDSVRFQIEQVYNSMSSTYRYDKRSAGVPEATLINNGLSLKAKYDQWRGFLRKYTGTNKSYLQGFNVQTYAALIKSIEAKGGADAATLKEHLEVRNMIVRFLVDIAFISNKYCVVIDGDKEEKLIELEKIRKELFGIQDFSVISSCTSPSAAKYIADSGYTLVREFGHFLDQGQFSQDPSRLLEPIDFGGTRGLRSLSMALMTVRVSPSINNVLAGFAPSMMDEPDIRAYVQFLILDRLVNGVRIAHDNSKSQYAEPKTDLFSVKDFEKLQANRAYVNFNNEAMLAEEFTMIMAANLPIPSAPDDGRSANLRVITADATQIENVKQVAADYIEYLGVVLFVQNRNSFAGQVMGRFKTVLEQKQLMRVTPTDLEGIKAPLLTTLKNANIAFEPGKEYTVLDVINMINSLQLMLDQISASAPALAQPVTFAVVRMFRPEIQVFGQVNQIAQAQGLTLEQLIAMMNSAVPEEKTLAEQILLQPLGPIYEQMKLQDPTLTLPVFDAFNGRFDKVVSEHKIVYKNYSKNAEELDSQLDLLQRIVQLLAR